MDSTITTERPQASQKSFDRSLEEIGGSPDEIALVLHNDAITRGQPQDKRKLYKTAQATIGCALFDAGQFIAVRYSGQSEGNHWFEVSPSKDFTRSTMYHEAQLAHFCL